MQHNLRLRQASPRTEEAYLGWIRRIVRFHGRRHPREMGVVEIRAFLTHLGVEGRMASATVAQARSALRFLYRQVLDLELEGVEALPRGWRPVRLSVALTREEVATVLRRWECGAQRTSWAWAALQSLRIRLRAVHSGENGEGWGDR